MFLVYHVPCILPRCGGNVNVLREDCFLCHNCSPLSVQKTGGFRPRITNHLKIFNKDYTLLYSNGRSYPNVRFPFTSKVSETSSTSLSNLSSNLNFSTGENMLTPFPTKAPFSS